MVASPLILGVDLGTSSLKAVLYTDHMEQLCSVRRGYAPPGASVTAEGWWQALLSALPELAGRAELSRVACVSFSGYNAFVGVDRALRQTTPVMLYYNTAPCAYMGKLFQDCDGQYVFHRSCANLFGSGIMAPGIRWLRDQQSEAYASTDCFLFSNGYVAARLTGQRTMDASRASLTALHDPRGAALTWDEDLCRFFGISPAKLPAIKNCWEAVGTVTPEAASVTGLPAGIPVAVGSMDSLCAALGNGITGAEQMLDIGGSAGGLACVSDRPRAHARLYLSRYALPGRWCNNAPLMSSARLFDWFCEKLAPGWSMEDFIRAVDASPCFARGLMFLPYVGGARYPYWSMDTQGHFLHFSPECTISDMARAVVEGLSCAYRSILTDLEALGVPAPQCIVAAGGDTRFGTWVQSRANYLRIPYHLNDTPEVSAKGAALLGANQIGLIPDLAAYLSAHASAHQIVEPEEPAAAFAEHYQAFQADCGLLYQHIPSRDW